MADWTLNVDKVDLAARFGKAAEQYDRHARIQQIIGDHLLSLLPGHNYEVALDLGCGTGFFLEKLQTLSQELIGVDLSTGMLAAAAAKGSLARLICGDAEQLPLASASCDLCFSTLALQWCASLPDALAEIRRVVRPGGHLALATLTDGSLSELRQAWRRVDTLDHVNPFICEKSLIKLCEAHGFHAVTWQRRRHVLHYPTLRELLTSLKGIGANQVTGHRATGLGGRNRLFELQQAYESQRDYTGLLPLSYEVCYGVLTR